MSDAIVHRSKRVIVHHQWVKGQYDNNSNIEVIPHFSYVEKEPTRVEIEHFKDKYNISDHEFIIATFGDINKNKLPNVKIDTAKVLIDQGYPVKLIFAGKIAPDIEALFEQLVDTVYEKSIFATGYLEEDDYFGCMYASDIIINLRNPSMGEASGTLLQSLFASRPTIIGNLNQYKEFPDEVIAGKISYDGNEIEQLITMIKSLLEDTGLRDDISQKAKDYSNSILGLEAVIKLILK